MRSHFGLAYFPAVLVLICVTAAAQTGRPSNDEVLNLLSKVDDNLAHFETTTDKLNFGRWNQPYGVVSSARDELDAARRGVTRTRFTISLIKRFSALSYRSTDLFDIFDVMMRVPDTAGSLAHNDPDPMLSKQLYELATESVSLATELRTLVRRQLAAQESDLEQCQSSREK